MPLYLNPQPLNSVVLSSKILKQIDYAIARTQTPVSRAEVSAMLLELAMKTTGPNIRRWKLFINGELETTVAYRDTALALATEALENAVANEEAITIKVSTTVN